MNIILLSVLITVTVLIVANFVVIFRYYKKTNDAVTTYGFNGVGGQTVRMNCPNRRKIRVKDGKLSCGNATKCESFDNEGRYTDAVDDLTDSLKSQYDGQQIADFTIPTQITNCPTCESDETQFNGVYDCVNS